MFPYGCTSEAPATVAEEHRVQIGSAEVPLLAAAVDSFFVEAPLALDAERSNPWLYPSRKSAQRCIPKEGCLPEEMVGAK